MIDLLVGCALLTLGLLIVVFVILFALACVMWFFEIK